MVAHARIHPAHISEQSHPSPRATMKALPSQPVPARPYGSSSPLPDFMAWVDTNRAPFAGAQRTMKRVVGVGLLARNQGQCSDCHWNMGYSDRAIQ